MPAPHVLICVPSFGTISVEWIAAFHEMRLATSVPCDETWCIRKVVSDARNLLVHDVIFPEQPPLDLRRVRGSQEAPHYSHLMFIDDDVIVPPDLITRLLAHDVDIVSGVYSSRQPPYHPTTFRLVTPEGLPDARPTFMPVYDPTQGLREVDAVGAGCLLIKREVFERIPPPWFNFVCTDHPRGYLGEDVFFCMLAKEHGLKIMVDYAAQCGHLGMREVTIADARATANATASVEFAPDGQQRMRMQPKAATPQPAPSANAKPRNRVEQRLAARRHR